MFALYSRYILIIFPAQSPISLLFCIQDECESGTCITSYTPPVCAISLPKSPTSYPVNTMRPTPAPVSTGPDESLITSFGPRAPEALIVQSQIEIIKVLSAITKIREEYWTYSGGTQMESSTGELSFEVTWTIVNGYETKAKILALRKMLDFDLGEQFKTLFNDLIKEQNEDLYIISIHESSLAGIGKQANVLGQQTGLSDADEVLGHGALYALDDNGNARWFCNNTWGWSETQVACRTMGFDFGIYLYGASQSISEKDYGESYTYWSNVNCNGDEDSIWHCSMDTEQCGTMVQSAVFLYCIRFS